MTLFDHVTEAPADPVFGLQAAFNADPRPEKINLSIGVYKNSDLKTPMLRSVKKAEQLLFDREKAKDYLPIEGDKIFLELIGALAFGEKFWSKNSSRTAALQAVGGTGALRLGAEFLKQEISDSIHLSNPTWLNHKAIFSRAGMKIANYPYYDVQRHGVDREAFFHYLEQLPPKSVVLLHAACHNPTGADLNKADWERLSQLVFRKNLVPFFDLAYQGFGNGFDEDAYGLRHFAEAGHELLLAYSLSKNFALYSERVGALFVVGKSAHAAQAIASKVKIAIRTLYSNPPSHGVKLASLILGSPELKKEWEEEVASMRRRIKEMREAFIKAAHAHGKDFHFLNELHGLFSISGLDKAHVERLIAEHAIYMTSDGRFNISGLSPSNLDRVVRALSS